MTMGKSDFEITLSPLNDIDRLRDRWLDLQTRAVPSFFLTWTWIGRWLETTGATPLVLEARLGSRTVALALLQATDRRSHGRVPAQCLYLHQTGHPNQDRLTIEYNGILADTDSAPGIVEQCIDALINKRFDAPEWDELYLGGMDKAYADMLEGDRRIRLISQPKKATAVDLHKIRESGQPYLQTLSSNTRQQVRRSIRLYEKQGPLCIEPAADVKTALCYLDQIGPMHIRHWNTKGQPSGFQDSFFVSFHQSLIAEGLPKGEIELLRVSAGDAVIGYLYNFLYDQKVYFYLSAFQYHGDSKLKPGLVSHSLAVDYYLDKGAALYDFMAGADRYKSSLGNTEQHLYWLIAQRKRLKFRLEDMLRSAKAIADHVMRRT